MTWNREDDEGFHRSDASPLEKVPNRLRHTVAAATRRLEPGYQQGTDSTADPVQHGCHSAWRPCRVSCCQQGDLESRNRAKLSSGAVWRL